MTAQAMLFVLLSGLEIAFSSEGFDVAPGKKSKPLVMAFKKPNEIVDATFAAIRGAVDRSEVDPAAIRVVSFSADATPWRSGGREAVIAWVANGIASPIPSPIISMPGSAAR